MDTHTLQAAGAAARSHVESYFSQTPPMSEQEREHGQPADQRRSRGRPQGAKDRKPRKRRRRRSAGGTANEQGEGNGGTSPPAGEGRGSRVTEDGSTLFGQKQCGRHKPWKIVLTAADAMDIYKARTTGKLAASVCAHLAETHSVHAKVRTVLDGWRGTHCDSTVCY